MGGSSKLNNFSKLITKKLMGKDRILCTILNGLKTIRVISKGEIYLGYQKSLDPLYDWADVIVGGGGVSSYERLAFKKPSLVFILSEDQRLQSEYIEKKGGHLLMKDGLKINNINLELNKLLEIKDLKLKDELYVSRNGVNLVSKLIYERIMSL